MRDNDKYDYDGELVEKDGMFYNSYAILPVAETKELRASAEAGDFALMEADFAAPAVLREEKKGGRIGF